MKDYTEHRDFYLLVRELMNIDPLKEYNSKSNGKFMDLKKRINDKLTDFTKSEQESLPFKTEY